jgi:hypothetical protein
MELDNAIYIIITVVILVVGLLGQSKKKKFKKLEVNDDVVYSLNDFEKILLRKEEFRNAEPTVDQAESSEITSEEDNITEKPDLKTQRRFQSEDKETDDGFDIKSAIIYSSILERKKFRK